MGLYVALWSFYHVENALNFQLGHSRIFVFVLNKLNLGGNLSTELDGWSE